MEVGGIARERLQSFVERIERLEDEKDALTDAIQTDAAVADNPTGPLAALLNSVAMPGCVGQSQCQNTILISPYIGLIVDKEGHHRVILTDRCQEVGIQSQGTIGDG